MGCKGEKLEGLNKPWTHDILSMATVPYDHLFDIGYVCNVMLAFNVNLVDNSMIIMT